MIEAISISAIVAFLFIRSCVKSYQRELEIVQRQRIENLRIKAMQFPCGSIKRVAHLKAANHLELDIEFGSQSRPAQ